MRQLPSSCLLLSFLPLGFLLACGGSGSFPANGMAMAPTAAVVPAAPGAAAATGSTAAEHALYVYVGDLKGKQIRGFVVQSDGGAAETPGSPYQFPSYSIAADPAGKLLFGADGNNLSSASVNADGSLTSLTTVTDGYSAVSVSPDGSMVLATNFHDYQKIDYQIYENSFAVSATGELTPSGQVVSGTDASVPILMTATGKYGYQAGTRALNPTVLGYSFTPGIGLFDTRAFIPPQIGCYYNRPEGIAVSPDGHFLAASFSASTGVVLYEINSDGTLAAVPGSPFFSSSIYKERLPGPLVFDPAGRYLAVGTFAGIQMFAVENPARLNPVGGPQGEIISAQIAFSPDGSLLFVTQGGVKQSLSIFSISNGSLTPAPGSPIPLSFEPTGLAVVNK
jgi:DNA-binding beta-propeller fold protein YncE